FHRVLVERLGRIAALLRTVVHQSVLANIEIARPGAAAPLVFLAIRDIVLKVVELTVAATPELLGFEIDRALLLAKRPKLAAAVMNDPHRRAETQIDGSPPHR